MLHNLTLPVRYKVRSTCACITSAKINVDCRITTHLLVHISTFTHILKLSYTLSHSHMPQSCTWYTPHTSYQRMYGRQETTGKAGTDTEAVGGPADWPASRTALTSRTDTLPTLEDRQSSLAPSSRSLGTINVFSSSSCAIAFIRSHTFVKSILFLTT